MASPNTLKLRTKPKEPTYSHVAVALGNLGQRIGGDGTLRRRPPGPKLSRRQKRVARKARVGSAE